MYTCMAIKIATLPVRSLDTPSYAMIFLYLNSFLHCRCLLKLCSKENVLTLEVLGTCGPACQRIPCISTFLWMCRLASRLTPLEPPASFHKRSGLQASTLLPSLATLLLSTPTLNYSYLVGFFFKAQPANHWHSTLTVSQKLLGLPPMT